MAVIIPSMKANELLRLLGRQPLSYQIARQKGSHMKLVSEGRPSLTFAFHQSQELPPGLVRKILKDQVQLTDDEIRLLFEK